MSSFIAPLSLTLTVLLSAIVAVSPVHEVGRFHGAVTLVARLDLTPAYVAMAPVSGLLDTLSLLSIRQHIALLATVLLVAAAWCTTASAVVGGRRRGLDTRVRRASLAVAVVLALYVTGVVVPRPMAALRVEGADAIVVDFHSHTSGSRDARRGFTAADNRSWHEQSGFHVAYVTDHGTFGAEPRPQGWDPTDNGEATVLLPGLEARHRRGHLLVLGGVDDDDDVEPDGVDGAMMGNDGPSAKPVSILAMPGSLDSIAERAVNGVELVDAAPRGLDQFQRDVGRLVRIADSLNLALVAGSNNHGWGRTAAAWSVMSIPRWRAMRRGALSAAIQGEIRRHRREAVRVIARHRVEVGTSAAELPLVLPAVVWELFTTMSWPERRVWLLWIWGVWGLTLAAARFGRSTGVRQKAPAFAPVGGLEPVALMAPATDAGQPSG